MRILRRPRRRFRFTPLLAAILLISSLVSAEAPAVAPVSLEYQIKASFIFNFLQFIEWPQQLQGVPPSTVRLCVAGDNPFGAALDTLDGELVNGMRMNVVRTPVANTADLESCEVIFFFFLLLPLRVTSSMPSSAAGMASQKCRKAFFSKPMSTNMAFSPCSMFLMRPLKTLPTRL